MPSFLLRGILSRFFRPLILALLRPLLRRLALRDTYLFGCRLRVVRGVFQPGLYFSTKLLAQCLLRYDLRGKSLLDMGTGSGALGILASNRGSQVLGVDVNPSAVSVAQRNAALNRVEDRFECVESDLFEGIGGERRFDYIVFNPPFYLRYWENIEDRAWFGGENYQTLKIFFSQARRFLRDSGRMVLILSSEMDLTTISGFARKNGWRLNREIIVPHFFENFMIREYGTRE